MTPGEAPMQAKKNDTMLAWLAAAAGAAIWIVIAAASGRREAWDSGAYFTIGIPAVCIVAMAFAYARPQRSWRWGVLPMAGQLAWMLVTERSGSLLPLGIVAFGILSIPSVIAARVAAAVARRRSAQADPAD
jgi:hypothetical protein